MVLNTSEQQEITSEYCVLTHVQPNAPGTLSTEDIRLAAVELDLFITANLVAINNALPLPFRTTANQAQKLRLFKLVVARLELQ